MKKFSQFSIALSVIFAFAVNASEPQIHIKTRFIEVSGKKLQDFIAPNVLTNSLAQSGTNGLVGLLTDKQFKSVLRALEAEPGIETLAEPELITTSGRQTQVRATKTIMDDDVVFDVVVKRPVKSLEVGPFLDVVPDVLSDGYTINLTLNPSVTELFVSSNSVPKISSGFRVSQEVATLNLWDGQTAMISGLPEKDYINGKEVFDKSKSSDKELLVLITVTLVDPAGSRIHSDEELTFAQKGFPPQPK